MYDELRLKVIVRIVKDICKELKEERLERDIELMNIQAANHKQLYDLYTALKANFPSVNILEPLVPPICYTELLPGEKVIEGKDKVSLRVKQYLNSLKLQKSLIYNEIYFLNYVFQYYFIYTNYHDYEDYTYTKNKLAKKLDIYRSIREFFSDSSHVLAGQINQNHVLSAIKRTIKYKYDSKIGGVSLDPPNGLTDIKLNISDVYKIKGLTQAIVSKVTVYAKSKGLDLNSFNKQVKLFTENMAKLVNLDIYRDKSHATEELSFSSDYYNDEYSRDTRNCTIRVLDNKDKREWYKDNYVRLYLSQEFCDVTIYILKFRLEVNQETKLFELENTMKDIISEFNNMSSYKFVRLFYVLTEFNKNYDKLHTLILKGKTECQSQI